MNISHGPAPPIYEHSPIQRQRSIRLLTLFAADDFEATLGAKLRIHRLDSAPEYIALSYVWGKAEATIPIYIDGHMLKIRKNLSVALKRWRRRQGTFRIWVDAICINQEDNDEKSSQVQLMRFIYQSARMVLIYLEEADGWEEANKVMQHLCEAKKDGILPHAFYTPSHGIDEGIFSASGHSDPAFRSQEIQGSHILSVRGLIFDSIEQVGTCRTDIKEQVGSVEEIVSLITECLVEAHKLLLSRDGYRHFPNESRASVLSRLATCDIDGNDWNLRSPVHNQTAMAMVLDHSIKKLLNGPHSEAYVANIKDIMVDWNPPGFGCDVYLFVAVAIFRLRSQRFITSQGYIGQAPQSVEIGRSKGDKVVLIAGCSVPFILRPQADGRYSVLGDCYLHGIMDGEAWDEGQAVAMEIV
ncbi:unnamed protein product [Clonostachys rosea f. rosea IK726]|uniref:Uncharacterized protein n=1 Tax=Clonostachys rosea f. rosea IK726 TaxID=1349383 RepID=A0ACA9U6F9_BIOOC|nr:unnamed protein product [Clonostachys rosea f. rosea IK726]